ncbi:heme-binding domain-containing protein [Parafilimonas sp.]|uniref:heme-binding domain-containing protein n=1 Tax=Parafilimonas sp. TaxID=1969739 RepID=UPI003F7FD06D
MKRILLILLIILVAIQFIRSAKNMHPEAQTNNISKLYSVPDDVEAVLVKACNDCHSNNTHYPWYSNIQPVAWWLHNHVEDGKEELNFDEFASYPLAKQYHKLHEIEEQLDKNEMPLSSYTLIHTDAKLNNAEKNILITWSKHISKQMETKYPKDSLERKRNR